MAREAGQLHHRQAEAISRASERRGHVQNRRAMASAMPPPRLPVDQAHRRDKHTSSRHCREAADDAYCSCRNGPAAPFTPGISTTSADTQGPMKRSVNRSITPSTPGEHLPFRSGESLDRTRHQGRARGGRPSALRSPPRCRASPVRALRSRPQPLRRTSHR